jgi:5-methylcytosine-specific restriction endonuclease McrA
VVAVAFCPAHEPKPSDRGSWNRGSTRAGRKDRGAVLARDPTCYLRLPGCTLVSTVDEHVVPLSQGGSLTDLGNRRGACDSCNHRKRHREALAGRGRAPAFTGLPDVLLWAAHEREAAV